MAKPYTVGRDPNVRKGVSVSPYRTVTEYDVDEQGNITPRDVEISIAGGGPGSKPSDYDAVANQYTAQNLFEAQQKSREATNANLDKKINDLLAPELQRNSLAAQIQALTAGGGSQNQNAGPEFNQALSQLSAGRNYGSSDLGSKLNFQVSDDQIVQDYNNSKLSRLNSVIDRGNTQIAGIQERLNSANELLSSLPAGSAQRKSSETFINQLNNDLKSVTSAVTGAQDMQKNFTPITMDSPEGLKEITSFRSFLQLPEERASQQLYQIDPDSYNAAVSLGRQYRDMATRPIGDTTTQQTEDIRNTIEQEAMNQLRLGSTIGAEERRGYEQSIRGAQTARGNIFGLGPAVQEASQIGAAGEQRKLARFGAAQQFLGSGETTGAAKARDLILREGIQQNRLGAASGFIAGGPSIYNLANQRVGQQQNAMQGYIQANQSLPGGFNQQASTAGPFYQAVDQNIPVALTNAFNDLYRSQSSYQASTYGAQVGAQAQVDSANSLPNYLSAGANVLGKFTPGGIMGGSQGGPIFCWVAREVYGIDNPKWIEFRNWMAIDAPAWFRNLYVKFGERIAEFISNKPILKSVIRKWMDSKIG